MVTRVDYLVVGSGLTGSTIARVLADHHREVLVLERRPHTGGNVHDVAHPSGVRVHVYGPHYFRCSSLQVWEFMNRFAKFYPHEAKVKTLVNGRYDDWPLNGALWDRYRDWRRCRPAAGRNFEEACLLKMPRPVYDTYIAGYTRRQWGMDPRLLDAALARRIRINYNGQTSLTPDCLHQGLPSLGYADLMANMLAGIPCLLGLDYVSHRFEYQPRKALLFTGPIDEFFNFDAGPLSYRGQRREHQFYPRKNWHQPCGQVNHPDAGHDEAIRTLEWKHLLPAAQHSLPKGTIVTREFPFTPQDPNDFEYPVPSGLNHMLYENYRRRARVVPKLIVCGRLGEFRYLDMDQAVERALNLAKKLCANGHGPNGPTPEHIQPGPRARRLPKATPRAGVFKGKGRSTVRAGARVPA